MRYGEIGLDYYWNKENKEEQKEVFQKQIAIADKLELPIVIHCREAYHDMIQILKEMPPKKSGVFHCCPLNLELIKEAISLDFFISFAGPVTFQNAKNSSQAIKMVPLEKILIETDSPYLAPDGFRGRRNDSRHIKIIANKIAQEKKLSLEEIATKTTQNAKKLFSILS